MIDLNNTTFLIPVYIDSNDRLENSIAVLGYLNHHFQTNVIIHEFVDDVSKLDLSKYKNLRIQHITEKNELKVYHRTRQLNLMLSMVKTSVVCNYDIDVILPVHTYLICEYLLHNKIFDLVYPYGFGNYQIQVDQRFSKIDFNFDLNNIDVGYQKLERAEYGHCMFFNTESYKRIGGENEEFISYGPEDSERYQRAFKFGLNIHRIKDRVYHFEHSRTKFSNQDHENYFKNKDLYVKLTSFDSQKIFDYYVGLDYLKKYNFKLNLKNNETSVMEVKKPVNPIEPQQPIVFQNNNINVNLCSCGYPKDRVKYNYCQKCNKIY